MLGAVWNKGCTIFSELWPYIKMFRSTHFVPQFTGQACFGFGQVPVVLLCHLCVCYTVSDVKVNTDCKYFHQVLYVSEVNIAIIWQLNMIQLCRQHSPSLYKTTPELVTAFTWGLHAIHLQSWFNHNAKSWYHLQGPFLCAFASTTNEPLQFYSAISVFTKVNNLTIIHLPSLNNVNIQKIAF